MSSFPGQVFKYLITFPSFSNPPLTSLNHFPSSSILLHFSFASYSTFCILPPLFFDPPSFFLRILFYFLHFTSSFLPSYFIFPSHPILLSAFHLPFSSILLHFSFPSYSTFCISPHLFSSHLSSSSIFPPLRFFPS